MNTKSYLAIGTVATSILLGTWALASQRDEREAAELTASEQPTISLGQAVAIAEQHAQGKAVGAELEQDDGRAYYEVELTTAGRIVEVKVDVRDGSVVGIESGRATSDVYEGRKDHD